MHAAFFVAWEAQSQVASVAFVALVAFGSIWLALPVMLSWALIATLVYSTARSKGCPDILERDRPEPRATTSGRLRRAICSVFKIWCAGFQAFVFTRASRVLVRRRRCAWHRLTRFGVLAVGLTLFGVSTTEHLLRNAGYRGSTLLQLSLLGPFLNVPYRTLLSAAVAQAIWGTLRLISSAV
ncbi:MAG TPA: hypothetical protein VJB57_10635 [Dehalococcoidia bacterium]|nr:hypothetical protein [Dehalococcoidia bacterium]